MPKYKCKNLCYGYQDRLWNPGDVVEVSDKEKQPPKAHFDPMKRKYIDEVESPDEKESKQDPEKEPAKAPDKDQEPSVDKSPKKPDSKKSSPIANK